MDLNCVNFSRVQDDEKLTIVDDAEAGGVFFHKLCARLGLITCMCRVEEFHRCW